MKRLMLRIDKRSISTGELFSLVKQGDMSNYPVVKVPFLDCALTAYANVTPVLDVMYFAEFLRGPDGTCAFCHGDPCAESPCENCGGGYIRTLRLNGEETPLADLTLHAGPGGKWGFQRIPHAPACNRVTWIDREFAASYSFETCPCCEGRRT